jgi:hypothetical protein
MLVLYTAVYTLPVGQTAYRIMEFGEQKKQLASLIIIIIIIIFRIILQFSLVVLTRCRTG